MPLFLEQLVEALRCEQESPASKPDGMLDSAAKTADSVESSRTAALHGKELLEKGYTVDQVVHDYGDICQAVTELATETERAGQRRRVPHVQPPARQRHRRRRVLVRASSRRVRSAPGAEQDQREWRGTLGDEQRRLLDTAVKAFDALKVGNIGLRGATGALLEDEPAEIARADR